MPSSRTLRAIALAIAIGLFTPLVTVAQEGAESRATTAFTYQGRLERDGVAADGLFDLSFQLFDDPRDGRSWGRVDLFDVTVRNGRFAVELDYGRTVADDEPWWLEVEVRGAGDGAYARLAPRQRLAGKVAGACVTDSDVLINGVLDVDPVGAEIGIDVFCCNNITADGGGGQLRLNGFLQELAMDNDELQSRGAGGPSTFKINPYGGNVGIGVAGTPAAPLQLPVGPDASVGGGGALVVGSTTSTNIAVDGNEIMARDNGGTALLSLNYEGGDVRIGGNSGGRLDIGLVRTVVVLDQALIDLSCPAGTFIVTGGCYGGTIINNYPRNATTWRCFFDDSTGNAAVAVCGRLKW